MTDVRKELGYKMADRQQGLDAVHMFMVVKELARIHAFGWCYKQLNKLKDITEHFPFLFVGDSEANMQMFTNLVSSNIDMTIDAIKDDVCAEAIEGLKRLQKNLRLVMSTYYSRSAAMEMGSLLRIPLEEKFKATIDKIDTESKYRVKLFQTKYTATFKYYKLADC